MACVYYLNGSGPMTEFELDDALLREEQIKNNDIAFSKKTVEPGENFGKALNPGKKRTWQQRYNAQRIRAANDEAFKHVTKQRGKEKLTLEELGFDDPIDVKNKKDYIAVTMLMQQLKNVVGGKPNNPVFPIVDLDNYWARIAPYLKELVSGNHIDEEFDLGNGNKKVFFPKYFVDLLFGQDSNGNLNPPHDISEAELPMYRQRMESIWATQAVIGSEIHEMLSYLFNNYFGSNKSVNDIYQEIISSDDWQNKYNNKVHEEHFDYLNYQENDDFKLLKDAINTYKTIEKEIINKYKGNNPIVYTEVNVIGNGLVNSKEVGVLGRIDLLVMDDKGNVEIIDFKCSPKPFSDYDPAKTRTFRYQLAIYRKLMQQLGLQSERRAYQLTVVPILFGNFAYNTDDNSVSYQNITIGTSEQTLLTDIEQNTNILSEVVEGNIDIVLKDSKIEDLTDEGIVTYVNDFMSKAFPQWHKYMNSSDEDLLELIKDYIEKHCTFTPKEEGKGYILYDKKNKRTWEGETEDKIIKNIKEEWKAARYRSSQIADDITKALLDGQKGKGFSWKKYGKLKNEDYSRKDWVEKVIGKYATPDWKVITSEDFVLPGQDPRKISNSVIKLLNQYGIILLENKNTHLIEVLKCTNRELTQTEFLGGTRKSQYILGTFLDDDVQARDPNSLILESRQGNVQLMEVMAVLNGLSGFLTKQNRAIGQITIINPEGYNYTGGLTASNKQLLYNFNRLCKLTGMDNNYLVDAHTRGIQMLNYAQLVQKELLSIQEQAKDPKRNSIGLRLFLDIAEGFTSKFDEFIGNKEALLYNLQKLKEDMEEAIPTLKGTVSKQLEDFADSQDILIYNDILQAISQVSGFDMVQQVNNNEKFFNFSSITDLLVSGLNGSYTDNPGTLKSANLNKMASTTERGYQNVRIAVVKFNTELQKALRKLKEEKGFTSLRKYTIGNQAELFANLYDKDAKKQGKLQFKNAFDTRVQATLSSAEIEFLQFAIRKLANDRWNLTKEDGTFNEEVFQQKLNANPDDVLKVPLIRADFSSMVANAGGIFQAIKNYFKQFLPSNIAQYVKDKTYELLDISNNKGQNIKNAAKNGDIYEMINRIQNSYDDDLRERILIKYDKEGKPDYQVDYFETNLEKILLSSNMAKNLQKEMNKIFPIMKSIVMGLTMQGFIQNTQFINDIEYAQDYIKNKILGLPLEDLEKWSTIRAVTQTLGSAASKLALAFNPLQLYQVLDGFWKDIMLVIQKPDLNPDGISAFSRENMTDAFLWITKDIWHYGDKPSLGEAINRTYGLNDMDINQFAKQLSTDNAGIFNFWSLGFRFTTRPDYYNRLTIFVAQMRELGCWEAHSMSEDGELLYDWAEDKRFNLYAKGDKSNLAEYNKQKALYLTMAREFIDEGAMDVDGVHSFKLGTDEHPTALPRAFTTKQSESLKALGDKIYGYYAHEKKSMIQSYTIGAMFMQMHTYWSSKKNQYISGHGFTQQGEFRQYSEIQIDENGNQVEREYWMDENGQPTLGNTGVPYLVWKGRPQEGILVTLSNLLRETIFGLKDENGNVLTDENGQKMIGFSYMYRRYFSKDSNINPYIKNLYRANMRQLFYDLFMLFFVGMIVGRSLTNATREHIKETGNEELANAFMNTCLYGTTKMIVSSADDFNFIHSIFGQGVNWTPFSIGMITRQVNNMVEVLGGDRDTYDGLINVASATRNTKPIWDYVKINTVGRKIGQKAPKEE